MRYARHSLLLKTYLMFVTTSWKQALCSSLLLTTYLLFVTIPWQHALCSSPLPDNLLLSSSPLSDTLRYVYHHSPLPDIMYYVRHHSLTTCVMFVTTPLQFYVIPVTTSRRFDINLVTLPDNMTSNSSPLPWQTDMTSSSSSLPDGTGKVQNNNDVISTKFYTIRSPNNFLRTMSRARII